MNRVMHSALLLFVIAIMAACGNKKDYSNVKPDEAFENFVSAYTSGVISKNSKIQLVFSNDMISGIDVNRELEKNPFEFTPSIAGKAKWLNKRTVIFTPDELLPSNQKFIAEVNLHDLAPSIPDSLGKFYFSYKVRNQSYSITNSQLKALSAEDLTWQTLEGEFHSNDYESPENIAKILTVSHNGQKQNIKWEFDTDNKTYKFKVDSIQRLNKATKVVIDYDATAFGVDYEGTYGIPVAALGDFKVTKVKSFSHPDQYILVKFSDPIKKDQILDGLVSVKGQDVSLEANGNTLKVYPKHRLRGNYIVRVDQGIQNVMGHHVQNPGNHSLTFTEIKPQVEAIGKKTIIPNSTILPFNFRAVGLSHVDMRVIKISEKNVSQFLQVNELEGSYELKRVGHVIAKKKIDLNPNNNLDLGKWNVHSIDLAPIINVEPGAIYEVAIGYRRDYSLYTCNDTVIGKGSDMLALDDNWHLPDEIVQEEDSYWDYYDEPSYSYNYNDRNDPCKNAYYSSSKLIKRNVLASSIGLIAKRGSNGDMYIVASDIKSTKPLANITLEVYNYQQHLLKRVTTNEQGIASFKLKQEPFLLVGKKGREKGYLKLDRGTSLSLSKFDVDGKKYHKGIKGFIFGERGVWRPGDNIYLNFILEDELKTLPKNHPISFEFINPNGTVVERVKKLNGLNGFYSMKCKTKPSDITGNYTAKVHVGGATFQKTIKVEMITPNRLKMQLDFGVDYLSKETKELKAPLEVKWLHGAIAKNLKADIAVSLKPVKTKFSRYQDYEFDDPSKKFSASDMVIFDGELDENGIAEIQANITAGSTAPGMLKANFKGKVFEPGGNFSTDRFSVPYHPYDYYVGLKLPKGDAARGMLLTDTSHTVNIAMLDKDGKPVSDRFVDVAIYKISWKWWWDQTAYSMPQYNGRLNTSAISTGKVKVKDGEASWKFKINYPSWGRYLVKVTDKDGHSSGKIVYIDWPGWAGRSTDSGSGNSAKMLTFNADKKNYKVGEDITLMIPTPNKGRALVSIESGTKVLKSYWVNATNKTSKLTFKATSDMAPNVYAHVTLLQPHAHFENDRPIRLHGVIPLMVHDPRSKLHPKIEMADVLEPESNVSIKVSETSGKPMTYVVAVVDEGLLGLTRFKTPNPWSTFYQRQALDVMTWDLYDDIIGAEGHKVRNLLSIGGDGSAGGKEGKKPNRFKPVVKFFGPFKNEAGQTKNIQFKMPNYIGAVRTMVIARHNEAYGSAEKETPVKKPLMVLGTLPRVFGPDEIIDFPVTVFALEDHIKNVQVKLKTNDDVEILGAASQTIKFNGTGEQMAYFKLKAKNVAQMANLKVTATGGGESSFFEENVEIRCPNPVITKVQSKFIEEGKSATFDFETFGIAGTNAAIFEASIVPPIDLEKRLKYLMRYPHGCVEQTTSSVFPQVYLGKLQKLSESQKRKISKNIRAGIQRLLSFQTVEGGLSYWPGQYGVNKWGTNYAGNFMLEAQKAGYTVPKVFLEKWTNYQKQKAAGFFGTDKHQTLEQAYRLYLLVLAGEPDLGAMNRLRMQGSNLTNIAKAYLALAYAKAGHKSIAMEVMQDAGIGVAEYTELNGNFGSTTRDKAILLQTMIALGNKEEADALAYNLSEILSSKDHLNTQATAYSLIAMARFYEEGIGRETIQFSNKLNNTKDFIKVAKPIVKQALDFKAGKNSLTVTNTSEYGIHYRVITTGQPLEVKEPVESDQIQITMNYYDMEGQKIELSEIEQGTDLVVTATVSSNGAKQHLEQLALTAIFPSGWEIHNGRLDEVSFGASSSYQYQDIRDDRVLTYFEIKPNASKTFQFLVNTSYTGKYYLPSVYVEAMYDESIHAGTAGQWTKVVEEKAVPKANAAEADSTKK